MVGSDIVLVERGRCPVLQLVVLEVFTSMVKKRRVVPTCWSGGCKETGHRLITLWALLVCC